MSPDETRAPSYLDDLLLKTSRTFALSIPHLPPPTREEVAVAYLLFRIADTLEDATRWTSSKQVAELNRFGDLLQRPSAERAQALAQEWIADPPLEHEGYLELLSQVAYVMRCLSEQSPGAQEQIVQHTLRTVERMASFVERRAEGSDLQLRDVSDLQAYCYAVAGIVGEMLTELFTLGRENSTEDVDLVLKVLPPIVERLRQMSPLYSKYVKDKEVRA